MPLCFVKNEGGILTATTAFGVIVVTSNMHDFAYDVPGLFF
jgi:hypothetical protein